MRKLILMTVLSVFSALAFAQETPASEAANPPAAEGTPGPSNAVEKAANKFGSWLGRMAQTPVGVVKSLASGVKAGYNSNTAATPVVASSPAPQPEAKVAAVEAPALAASATSQADNEAKASFLRERFAGVLAMAQGRFMSVQRQAPAPVEDRSVRTVVTGSALAAPTDADKN